MEEYQKLATYRHWLEHCGTHWREFRAQRTKMLAQADRFYSNPEKVAENILACLFTSVLGWRTEDLQGRL